MTQDASDILTDSTINPLPSEEAQTPTETNTGGSTTEGDELKAQITQLREQLARSQADYNNLVRRSREELGQI